MQQDQSFMSSTRFPAIIILPMSYSNQLHSCTEQPVALPLETDHFYSHSLSSSPYVAASSPVSAIFKNCIRQLSSITLSFGSRKHFGLHSFAIFLPLALRISKRRFAYT